MTAVEALRRMSAWAKCREQDEEKLAAQYAVTGQHTVLQYLSSANSFGECARVADEMADALVREAGEQ
jgi:hypothetical protein